MPEIPLEEISRREVYREVGGADFTVTEIQTRVKATQEPAQFNVVSIKNGVPGTVCVIQSRDGKFLIGKHWRVSTQQWAWEFPRGMGEAGETVEGTALRELQEETGITESDITGKPRNLGFFYPDTGLQSIKVAAVEIQLAEGAHGSAAHADWELSGGTQWLSADELRSWISSGEMTDGMTLVAFALWEAHHRA
ncbi:NUDIX hydrolase [Alloscardovia criceti]|uniref:NUDIX hydrolase n=1 Tax=Alloscardovia criceti TaxID=356828 RepID=UPI00037376F4|nr:NUDIX hydrolase [Alloscardovia criceti]